VYRVRAQWTGGIGGPYLTTQYFSSQAGPTAANANAALGAFFTAVKSLISNTITVSTLSQVDTLDDADGHPIASTAVTPVTNTGTASGDVLPPATQGLCQVHTGQYVNNREIRGRLFLGGMMEANSTLGVPTSGTITTVNTALAAMISDANSEWLVWSRRNAVGKDVASAVMWATWAQLRTRRQ
jgi:hypothetical protein